MKITNFRGDVIDVSAKTEALCVTQSIRSAWKHADQNSSMLLTAVTMLRSDVFLASETSVRSPRKLFIFII